MIEPGFFASTSRFTTACATKKAARTFRLEDGVEVLDRHIDEQGRSVGARIVHKNVERLGLANERANRIDIGDVERRRAGLAVALADLGGRRFDLVFVARHQRDMRAGLGERRCGRKPDAAPGAGDQRALAVQAERGGDGKRRAHERLI